MTLIAYFNGAEKCRVNLVATATGQEDGNGFQVRGEWVDIWVKCVGYRVAPSRTVDWLAEYRVELRELATYARLDHSECVLWDGRTETNTYHAQFVGPDRTTREVGVASQLYDQDETSSGVTTNYRSTVKLYFVGITHKILRDPQNNNLILRPGTLGLFILRDA